jgi:hypothetical protein
MSSLAGRRLGVRLRLRLGEREDDDRDGLRRLVLRGGDLDRLIELEYLRLLGTGERRLTSDSEPLSGEEEFRRRAL